MLDCRQVLRAPVAQNGGKTATGGPLLGDQFIVWWIWGGRFPFQGFTGFDELWACEKFLAEVFKVF